MALRRSSPWLVAVGVAFAVSRAWLALDYVPRDPDYQVYERYARLGRRAAHEGTSVWQEVARFWDRAERAGRHPPPEARVVEYPPLALVPMLVPLALAPPAAGEPMAAWEARYVRAFRLQMALVDLLLLLLLVRLVERWFGDEPAWRRALRLLAFVAGGVALAEFYYDRLDLVLAALIAWTLALLVGRARTAAALAVLALAIAYKLVPLVLVPLFALGALRGPSLRPLRALGWAALATGLGAVALALPAARWGATTLAFLGYHGARGLQVESPLASLATLAAAIARRPTTVTQQYGAWQLDAPGAHALALASTPLVACAVAAVTWALVRALRRRLAAAAVAAPADAPVDERRWAERFPQLFVNAAAATLVAALVSSKVLSPQYLVWLVPLWPLVRLGGRGDDVARWSFVALCALTLLVTPFLSKAEVLRYDPAVWPRVGLGPSLVGGLLLGARNAGLVALAVVTARRLDAAAVRA